MSGARARRVDIDRVHELLLARSVPSLHDTAVVLARDGLLADWAAIVDRSGTVLASTSDEIAGKGTLLAAVSWGLTGGAGDTVSSAPVKGFDAALVVGRRSSSMRRGERQRLGVLSGIVGVVWGHLSGDGDDRDRRTVGWPVRPTAV